MKKLVWLQKPSVEKEVLDYRWPPVARLMWGCISPFWNSPNFPSAKSLLPAAEIMVFSGLPSYMCCRGSAAAGETYCLASGGLQWPCVTPNCFSRLERRAALQRRDVKGFGGWKRRRTGRLCGPDVCSSSQPDAHLQSFELTWGIPPSLRVSIYFVLLNPHHRTMSCLTAFLFPSSLLPSVCHGLPPRRHANRPVRQRLLRAWDPLCWVNFKEKIKGLNLSVNIRFCVRGTDITSLATRPCLLSLSLNAAPHICHHCGETNLQRLQPQVLHHSKEQETGLCLSQMWNSHFHSVPLSGLNLTKGIKISIVLLLRRLAAEEQKQGVSSPLGRWDISFV